ncbi:MAG: GNAT family N-acetyltransferase [Candidatus Moranbacteria bacterium]|jgi:ribosomal protein S18 acetylase RimI-like enzyme|nr:GNAT family N-acetyltransferase [Candidatus Moranbacteria bacterium]MDD5651798.1 GNAT family N-acetyltransferase [Candidatus Moranbacteria bacterium]MDX9855791.1 GNAT family N-acetyltransferase [Candidatus Moranbacteria bacterium]
MDTQIRIREASIDEVIKIGKKVLGAEKMKPREHFEERYKDKYHLITVAYLGDNPAGYAVWYDKYGDGSLYCWMTGVSPDFRRKGILKGLMAFGLAIARNKRYEKIKTKVRNSERGMLAYLTKYGFSITDFEERPNNEDSKISFEKDLE